MTGPSPRRLDVLGSPREWTVLGAGDPRRTDRYRSLETIARVNVPRRLAGTVDRARLRDHFIDRTRWV